AERAADEAAARALLIETGTRTPGGTPPAPPDAERETRISLTDIQLEPAADPDPPLGRTSFIEIDLDSMRPPPDDTSGAPNR
ncbi:MAG: hypothetical protein GYA57_02120, partial [Myxococcales bacterium]|nr:hypothetical protein [Myxococcales bacterium]